MLDLLRRDAVNTFSLMYAYKEGLILGTTRVEDFTMDLNSQMFTDLNELLSNHSISKNYRNIYERTLMKICTVLPLDLMDGPTQNENLTVFLEYFLTGAEKILYLNQDLCSALEQSSSKFAENVQKLVCSSYHFSQKYDVPLCDRDFSFLDSFPGFWESILSSHAYELGVVESIMESLDVYLYAFTHVVGRMISTPNNNLNALMIAFIEGTSKSTNSSDQSVQSI